MEETSDGTMVMKCKLRTILQDDKLQPIITQYVKKLSKIIYKANELFRLYVFHCVDHKIQPVITETHINRCINLVKPGSCNLRAGKNAPEVEILQLVLKNNEALFNKMPTQHFKSSNRPLQYSATEMFTNIGVQISEHYERYQRKYLRCRISASRAYKIYNLTRSQVGTLAFQLQKAINANEKVTAFTSEHFQDPTLVEDLLDYLNMMVKVIREEIPEEIRDINMATLKSKDNYAFFVVYMHQMARYLQDHNLASFTPLPNPKLQRRHFLFDKRFLCVVYNELKNVKVNIKTFEADFEMYYREMFNTHEIYRTLCERKSFPKSYVTNGYTVSIIFSPKVSSTKSPKKKRPKSSEKGKKVPAIPIDHPEHRPLEPGLYDADNLRCSKEQLAQYHFTAIDPGNSKMLNCVTYDPYKDFGLPYVISKGYYNEISHITRNTKKCTTYTNSNPAVLACYDQLSFGSLKGGYAHMYLIYMRTIADNWDLLWKHALDERLPALSYDTYLHSKMAVAKVCRQIRKHNPTSKPSLYIIGKGNGNMTISNTKNSSSHGPIKRIVHALSLLEPVVLTDEYKTSQLCNQCTSKLVYPKMHFRKKLRKLIPKVFKVNNMTKLDYQILAPRVVHLQTVTNRKVHGVCYCSGNEHRRIIWQRDINSERCILYVAYRKLIGYPLTAFNRP
jgi:hypothetical protein